MAARVVTDKAEAFRAEVRAFGETIPAGLRHKVSNNLVLGKDDYLEYLQLLDRRGWSVGHWPQEYGGCGWSALERFIFDLETSRAGAPWLIPFGVNYVGPIIYTFGTERQKERFLPPIRRSTEWWAQGYSEPAAGSDLASLRTRARREGDHYVLNGQKIWTTYVQWADWIFCLARTGQDDRPQNGISFLLVDMTSPGISVRAIDTMDGYRHVNEVFFDDVRVPAENLVGEEGKGWGYGKLLLANERVLVAEAGRSSRQLGRLERLASESFRGGGRLVDDPYFRRRLSELKLRLLALRASCYQSVAEAGSSADAGAEASLLKLRGSELQQDIAEASLDALGSAGMIFDPACTRGTGHAPAEGPWEAPGVVRDHLHSRATTIYGGSNEIQRNIIAKAVLGL